MKIAYIIVNFKENFTLFGSPFHVERIHQNSAVGKCSADQKIKLPNRKRSKQTNNTPHNTPKINLNINLKINYQGWKKKENYEAWFTMFSGLPALKIMIR